jgi:hypothetical protein
VGDQCTIPFYLSDTCTNLSKVRHQRLLMASQAKPVFHNPSNLGKWTTGTSIESNSLQFQKEVEAVTHNNVLNDQICRALAESPRNHTQAPIQPPVSQGLLADQVVPSQWDMRTGSRLNKSRPWNEQNEATVNGVPVFTLPSRNPLLQQQLSKQQQVYSFSCGLI